MDVGLIFGHQFLRDGVWAVNAARHEVEVAVGLELAMPDEAVPPTGSVVEAGPDGFVGVGRLGELGGLLEQASGWLWRPASAEPPLPLELIRWLESWAEWKSSPLWQDATFHLVFRGQEGWRARVSTPRSGDEGVEVWRSPTWESLADLILRLRQEVESAGGIPVNRCSVLANERVMMSRGGQDWILDGHLSLLELLGLDEGDPGLYPRYLTNAPRVIDALGSGYLPLYYSWALAGGWIPMVGARYFALDDRVLLLDVTWQEPYPGWPNEDALGETLSVDRTAFFAAFAAQALPAQQRVHVARPSGIPGLTKQRMDGRWRLHVETPEHHWSALVSDEVCTQIEASVKAGGFDVAEGPMGFTKLRYAMESGVVAHVLSDAPME